MGFYTVKFKHQQPAACDPTDLGVELWRWRYLVDLFKFMSLVRKWLLRDNNFKYILMPSRFLQWMQKT